MDPGASNVIVQGFLKGSFDVFDALLGTSFFYDTIDIENATSENLRNTMSACTVGMRGTLKDGDAVVLFFPEREMANLVSLTDRGVTSETGSLDDTALATLREIADSALGGGVSNLTAKFGQEVAITKVEIVRAGQEGVADFLILLGSDAILATFQFKAEPHFEATAAMVFTSGLEQKVPGKLVNAVFGGREETTPMAEEPLVSDEEMKDILSGFDPTLAPAAAPRRAPDNLDLVLDIELTATARLGRIEMPIGDILNLGPGSILEVGQMIDDPVDLYVNDKLIARGDVVVVDEKFGLRITEIVSKVERIESLR